MCVRPSTASYGSFSLDMVRSPGFGSACTDLRPLQTWYPSGSLRLAVHLASTCNSPDRSTKSTRSRLNALPQLVNTGFQVLFHSPPGVLFTFPSQYYALSVTKPRHAVHPGLGSSAFARRYWRNRCFFLFLRLLRCFSSPGSPPCAMDLRMDP